MLRVLVSLLVVVVVLWADGTVAPSSDLSVLSSIHGRWIGNVDVSSFYTNDCFGDYPNSAMTVSYDQHSDEAYMSVDIAVDRLDLDFPWRRVSAAGRVAGEGVSKQAHWISVQGLCWVWGFERDGTLVARSEMVRRIGNGDDTAGDETASACGTEALTFPAGQHPCTDPLPNLNGTRVFLEMRLRRVFDESDVDRSHLLGAGYEVTIGFMVMVMVCSVAIWVDRRIGSEFALDDASQSDGRRPLLASSGSSADVSLLKRR